MIYWNGGYGTTFFKAWIDHLSLPLVRVGFTTGSGNQRMMRLGEKLGMKLEGRLRNCRLVNGKYYDSAN
ncbi:GNAT family N-acetyltransferase [Brevibacillus laterosporus]|uniref:GNAT family N-acetyltransferase n=1 Tax=Brevibacillus laterosporus TaxID=1465 RepID=UPI00345417BC